MRQEVIGIFSKVFCGSFLKFELTSRQVSIVIHVRGLRALFAYLRYGSLSYGTVLSDVSAVEMGGGRGCALIYIFFLRRCNLRLCVSTMYNWERFAICASEFFAGAGWPERECGEMFGIVFYRKLDTRRLMLDYAFEGAPLSKSFVACGYEEVGFNSFDN